jgi:hypothetical protein
MLGRADTSLRTIELDNDTAAVRHDAVEGLRVSAAHENSASLS